MKVTKQINLDYAKNFGLAGRDSSEISNQLQSLIRETDNNIDQRNDSSAYTFYGITVVLPKAVITPVEKCCFQDGSRYPFLYKQSGTDLIKALIRHYLFNDKLISNDNSRDIINRAVDECRSMHIEPQTVNSNLSYLRAWLIYKCNQILTNYIS